MVQKRTEMIMRLSPRPYCGYYLQDKNGRNLEDNVRKDQADRCKTDAREKRRFYEKKDDERRPDIFKVAHRGSEHRSGIERKEYHHPALPAQEVYLR